MFDNGNFVSRFIENTKRTPEKIALQLPVMDGQKCIQEDSIRYGELAHLVADYQQLWKNKGWKAGDRVIVILKPSKELYAIALALFSLGIVAVFIDTGMGRKKIQMAIRDSNAKAIISLSALIKLFWFVPALWPLQRFAIDRKGIGYQNLLTQLQPTNIAPISIARSNTDHGLISFTSGSTGRPKGADRTHFSLTQQHLAIRDHWPDETNDIDCPCFPVIVLHNLCCGMTTVMPKVDLAEPAKVNANVVVEQIRKNNVSRLSGAPAYIGALVEYLSQQKEGDDTVTEVKSLVVGGATVSLALAAGINRAFPNANARIVYGSTEAEPISDISIKDYLAEADHIETNQQGYLVGHAVSQIDLLITKIDDREITNEDELLSLVCSQGEIGEVLVSGDHVLKQYIDNPSANRENKIPRNNVPETKSVWHRTGDCGYLDEHNRLWLTGRVKDVIYYKNNAYQPFPIEENLDNQKAILRSAVICRADELHVFLQMQSEALTNRQTEQVINTVKHYVDGIELNNINIRVVEEIPVDGRHNSKIDRPLLREQLS